MHLNCFNTSMRCGTLQHKSAGLPLRCVCDCVALALLSNVRQFSDGPLFRQRHAPKHPFFCTLQPSIHAKDY